MPTLPEAFLSRHDQHIEVPLHEWHYVLKLASINGWPLKTARYWKPYGQLVTEDAAVELSTALQRALDDMDADDRMYYVVIDVVEFCSQGEFRVHWD